MASSRQQILPTFRFWGSVLSLIGVALSVASVVYQRHLEIKIWLPVGLGLAALGGLLLYVGARGWSGQPGRKRTAVSLLGAAILVGALATLAWHDRDIASRAMVDLMVKARSNGPGRISYAELQPPAVLLWREDLARLLINYLYIWPAAIFLFVAGVTALIPFCRRPEPVARAENLQTVEPKH